MRTFKNSCVFLVRACVYSGIYGVAHNQVTYTLNPVFFHLYTFRHCDYPAQLQNRLGASLVGFVCAWWMGLVAGVPIVAIANILFGDAQVGRRINMSFCVVLLVAIFFEVRGLICDFMISDNTFNYVDNMQDNSYYGGFVGTCSSILYLFLCRIFIARRRCLRKNLVDD